MTILDHSATDTGSDTATGTATGTERRLGRTRRALVAGLLGLGIATAGVVATPAPASAATRVGYCFVYDQPQNNYPSFQGYTQLQAWYSGRWNAVTDWRYSTYTCGSFTPSASWQPYAMRVAAGLWVGRSYFSGATNQYAPGGSGSYSLFGSVRCTSSC